MNKIQKIKIKIELLKAPDEIDRWAHASACRLLCSAALRSWEEAAGADPCASMECGGEQALGLQGRLISMACSGRPRSRGRGTRKKQQSGRLNSFFKGFRRRPHRQDGARIQAPGCGKIGHCEVQLFDLLSLGRWGRPLGGWVGAWSGWLSWKMTPAWAGDYILVSPPSGSHWGIVLSPRPLWEHVAERAHILVLPAERGGILASPGQRPAVLLTVPGPPLWPPAVKNGWAPSARGVKGRN